MKHNQEKATSQIHIYLAEDQLAAVNQICASTGITRAALLKTGIFYFLKAAEAQLSGGKIGIQSPSGFSAIEDSTFVNLREFAQSLASGLSTTAKLKRGRPKIKGVAHA